MRKRIKVTLACATLIAACAGAFGFEWEKSTPEESGIKRDVIEKVFSSFDDDVYSCVIIRDGKIVDEYFKEGYGQSSVFTLQSCSKSITSALVGIAIEQGYIKSVDDYAADYLPAISKSKYPAMKKITLKQLLNHTSGLVGTDSKIWSQWRRSSDWIDFILSRPMTASPGTYFEYSTGNTHLLSAILEKATGKKLLDYAQEVLFGKIGISSAGLGTDPQGVGDGGNGFSMTAYDMGRFGLLFLNGGKWDGVQVIPEKWVKDSTSIQARRNGSRYGYQWWLRNYGKEGYLGYNAQGYGGEYIFVVPQLNLIVVYTSWHEGNVDSYFYNVDKIVNATSKKR